MNLVFDSNAWISYFEGKEKSFVVERLIKENTGKIMTTAANLYEVKHLALRSGGRNAAEEAVAFIKNNSRIIPVDERLALHAAEIRASTGLSAIDAFTVAAAQLLNAKIVSGDAHFAPFKKQWMKI